VFTGVQLVSLDPIGHEQRQLVRYSPELTVPYFPNGVILPLVSQLSECLQGRESSMVLPLHKEVWWEVEAKSSFKKLIRHG
jgi:hypothetical protein